MQLAKEEQAKRRASDRKGKQPDNSEQEAPEHEKARLLTTESRDAIGLSADIDLEARLPHDRPRPSLTDVTRKSDDSELEQATEALSPEAPGTSIEPTTRSEKARGKMRERTRSDSLDASESLERIAAAGVGRNGFVPTQDWVTSWQHG